MNLPATKTLFLTILLTAALVGSSGAAQPPTADTASKNYNEWTVARLEAAMASGKLTSEELTNYYIARMNPLEDNFRVYKVVDGKRSKEFQNVEIKIPAGEWHTLKIKQVGDHIECFLDGKKYLDVKDDSITKAGKVGLWTKADAQSHFDMFTVSGK